MAVYVDDWLQQATVGRIRSRWSHLTADSDEELHAFAAQLGMRRAWAQYPGTPKSHYDVTESKRQQAIRLGATPISWREGGLQLREKMQSAKAAAAVPMLLEEADA